jgi:hypothetical protein
LAEGERLEKRGRMKLLMITLKMENSFIYVLTSANNDDNLFAFNAIELLRKESESSFIYLVIIIINLSI